MNWLISALLYKPQNKRHSSMPSPCLIQYLPSQKQTKNAYFLSLSQDYFKNTFARNSKISSPFLFFYQKITQRFHTKPDNNLCLFKIHLHGFLMLFRNRSLRFIFLLYNCLSSVSVTKPVELQALLLSYHTNRLPGYFN